MRRRKVLAGLGSLAAGGAALMGTGAFSSSEVSGREINVNVAADSDAFVELNALADNRGDNGPTYAKEANGQLQLLFNGDSFDDGNVIGAGPQGLNPNSEYNFDEVFQVGNPGTWGDLYFAISLNNFASGVDIELTADGSEANVISEGTSLLAGDYNNVDNLPKLQQPDACNIDITIKNTKESAVGDIGGTMTIYAASGGNRDELSDIV
jgi:hypothetical protein